MNKYTTALIIFIANCGFGSAYGQFRNGGSVDGQQVDLVLDHLQIDRTLSWNPNEETPPPVSIADALRIAKSALAAKYPKKKEVSWDIIVSLKKDGVILSEDIIYDGFGLGQTPREQHYIYFVRFINQVRLPQMKRTTLPDGGEKIEFNDESKSTDITLAVLMDGTPVLPTPKGKGFPSRASDSNSTDSKVVSDSEDK